MPVGLISQPVSLPSLRPNGKGFLNVEPTLRATTTEFIRESSASLYLRGLFPQEERASTSVPLADSTNRRGLGI